MCVGLRIEKRLASIAASRTPHTATGKDVVVERPVVLPTDVWAKVFSMLSRSDFSAADWPDPQLEFDEAFASVNSIFFTACQDGRVADVARLLSHPGVQVNAAKKDGTTPLLVACQHGHTSVVGILLEHGADANCTARNGATPLGMSCIHGWSSVAQLLVCHGANTSTRFQGRTPAALARTCGYPSLLTWARQCNNFTPLHWVCLSRSTRAVVRALRGDSGVNL